MDPTDVPPVLPLDTHDNKTLLNSVVKKFTECYGVKPAFVVTVPGRVNLIGEHVDYCGYSVLPMALQQHIMMAVKPSEDSLLNLVNVDPKYAPFKGDVQNFCIDNENKVQWFNYVLCGIRGVKEKYPEKTLHGMMVTVAGNILPNSGLSSSSALVCASALSTCHANGFINSKEELAALCAGCERYIGTEGGGMDQAIAFLANSGCAKHISFKPLRAADVNIPSGLAVIVAHSFAELNKAASDHFNQRVAECRLASVMIAKKRKLENWKKLSVLADVQRELNVGLPEMILYTSEILTKDVYSKTEIGEILEMSCHEMEQLYLPENTRNTEKFKLCQRATHVFAEAFRVEQFQEICENGGRAEDLGHLMNLSHNSLRDLYECSHPQLDALVNSAREKGAFGARLTGAG